MNAGTDEEEIASVRNIKFESEGIKTGHTIIYNTIHINVQEFEDSGNCGIVADRHSSETHRAERVC